MITSLHLDGDVIPLREQPYSPVMSLDSHLKNRWELLPDRLSSIYYNWCIRCDLLQNMRYYFDPVFSQPEYYNSLQINLITGQTHDFPNILLLWRLHQLLVCFQFKVPIIDKMLYDFRSNYLQDHLWVNSACPIRINRG